MYYFKVFETFGCDWKSENKLKTCIIYIIIIFSRFLRKSETSTTTKY